MSLVAALSLVSLAVVSFAIMAIVLSLPVVPFAIVVVVLPTLTVIA
jgi:hypothetical protein